MRKLLIIMAGIATFACDDGNNRGENNAANSVDKGAGKTISPQLEKDSASDARLDVDTVSSAEEIDQQQK